MKGSKLTGCAPQVKRDEGDFLHGSTRHVGPPRAAGTGAWPAPMKNRWFDRPGLHGEAGGRRASWLEILYDVLVAGALVALCDALSHAGSLDGFASFALAFAAVWLSWTGFTFYQNRFSVDDVVHRALVGAKLVAVSALGLAAPGVVAGETRTFSVCNGAMQLVLLALYLRAYRSVHEARPLTRYYAIVYGLATVVWLLGAIVPMPWPYGLWTLGVGLGVAFPLNRRSRELAILHPPDSAHMTERYGLFAIVLLGASCLRVLAVLAGRSDASALVVVALTVVLVVSLWWLYFDDVAGSSLKGQRGTPFVWVYAHLPMLLGIGVTTAGFESIARSGGASSTTDVQRWLVAGGLGLTLFAVALMDSVTERQHAQFADRARVNARIGAAVLALLVAPIGAGLRPLWFLALATLPVLAQVLFDLIMAPLAISARAEPALTSADFVRRHQAGDESIRPTRRARVGEAVRRGTPSELRQDFYFFFMEGSWSRLILSLVFTYVALNAVFAGLYLLEPGAIGNARPHSFADAFFFSVQTFSTIGFGVLTPATPYGNLVVTAEAAVGLLSAALATGLMFAKAARPRSSTLFSRVMVVNTRNGVPNLVFRAGNARGNEVVDATVTVTLLRDEISTEGHHLRRLHDLPLVRNRTPMFTLTWVVIHEITEASPLHGIDWASPKDLGAIIVTILGHDGTYGQTTYARHVYYPEDVRAGHRFVDVMSQLEDGRTLVDYGKFHDTTEDPPSPHGNA
jgi:inward rectifier potassium channel